MLGMWEGVPGTQIRQAVAEKILLPDALFSQQKKTAKNSKTQTMMVDKEINDKAKIYPSRVHFRRHNSLLFLVEYCRPLDGNGNKYFVWADGVLELPLFGSRQQI